jgi:hypothetical protein
VILTRVDNNIFSTMADESTIGIITAATVSTGSANEDTDDQEPVASVVTADEFLDLGLNGPKTRSTTPTNTTRLASPMSLPLI